MFTNSVPCFFIEALDIRPFGFEGEAFDVNFKAYLGIRRRQLLDSKAEMSTMKCTSVSTCGVTSIGLSLFFDLIVAVCLVCRKV